LRKRVGELIKRQIMENLVTENLKESVKSFLPMFTTFLPNQLLAQVIVEESAARGECQCKLLRRANALGRCGEKPRKKVADCLDPIFASNKADCFYGPRRTFSNVDVSVSGRNYVR
jgi:hypothetical protein